MLSDAGKVWNSIEHARRPPAMILPPCASYCSSCANPEAIPIFAIGGRRNAFQFLSLPSIFSYRSRLTPLPYPFPYIRNQLGHTAWLIPSPPLIYNFFYPLIASYAASALVASLDILSGLLQRPLCHIT